MRRGVAELERRGATGASTSNERGAAPVAIIGSLVAWAIVALVCIDAFGLVRGALIGVWGVSIAVIFIAAICNVVGLGGPEPASAEPVVEPAPAAPASATLQHA